MRWKGCERCRTQRVWHRWWCPALANKMLFAAVIFPIWMTVGLHLPLVVGLSVGLGWFILWLIARRQVKVRGIPATE